MTRKILLSVFALILFAGAVENADLIFENDYLEPGMAARAFSSNGFKVS